MVIACALAYSFARRVPTRVLPCSSLARFHMHLLASVRVHLLARSLARSLVCLLARLRACWAVCWALARPRCVWVLLCLRPESSSGSDCDEAEDRRQGRLPGRACVSAALSSDSPYAGVDIALVSLAAKLCSMLKTTTPLSKGGSSSTTRTYRCPFMLLEVDAW